MCGRAHAYTHETRLNVEDVKTHTITHILLVYKNSLRTQTRFHIKLKAEHWECTLHLLKQDWQTSESYRHSKTRTRVKYEERVHWILYILNVFTTQRNTGLTTCLDLIQIKTSLCVFDSSERDMCSSQITYEYFWYEILLIHIENIVLDMKLFIFCVDVFPVRSWVLFCRTIYWTKIIYILLIIIIIMYKNSL